MATVAGKTVWELQYEAKRREGKALLGGLARGATLVFLSVGTWRVDQKDGYEYKRVRVLVTDGVQMRDITSAVALLFPELQRDELGNLITGIDADTLAFTIGNDLYGDPFAFAVLRVLPDSL